MAKTNSPDTAVQEQGADYNVEAENVYTMTPYERIQLIRGGIPARRVDTLCGILHLSKEALIGALGLSRATISRKARAGLRLSTDESERILGVESLFRQAESMMDPPREGHTFDTGQWLGMWLSSPLPALANVPPIEYLDTIEGQKFVSHYLGMIESGAYA